MKTILGFLIEQLCLGSRTALLIQSLYDDLPILLADTELQPVADFHLFSRLDGGAIQLNFATVYGVACQAASLEEAGCP